MAVRSARTGDVDDIVQEAVTRAWRHRSSCRTPQQPWAWLSAIVYREIARAHGERAGDGGAAAELGVEDPRLAELIERDALRPALDRLDAAGREVILLHYYLDLPVREIARLLDMPEGSVKVKLARSRVKLRGTLT